jgi:glutathione peroxidase
MPIFMIKRLLFIFVLLFLSFGMMAQSSVYNYEVIDSEGQTVNLGKFHGKVLLIVNTATQCGFTPQYEALESMYKHYHAQ